MKRIKEFFKTSYGKVSTGLMVSAVSLPVFAAGESSTMAATIVASLQQVVTDTIATIAAVAPIGITIFGAMYCWKMGVKFFQKVAK